jgi:hypothetical protein
MFQLCLTYAGANFCSAPQPALRSHFDEEGCGAAARMLCGPTTDTHPHK